MKTTLDLTHLVWQHRNSMLVRQKTVRQRLPETG
jgi:hypothetical protein